jgi:hypothetical protein
MLENNESRKQKGERMWMKEWLREDQILAMTIF